MEVSGLVSVSSQRKREYILTDVDVLWNRELGGGGGTIPGGVQEVSGWGATRYGLVACGSNRDSRMVGLDLVGLFQPCDSMILWFYDSFFFTLNTSNKPKTWILFIIGDWAEE